MYNSILKELAQQDPGILLYIMTFMRQSFAIKFEHNRNEAFSFVSSMTEECHFAIYTSRYNEHAHSCLKKSRKAYGFTNVT